MSTDLELEHNPCIVAGIQPLLTELRQAVSVHFRAQHDPDREPLESFIRHIFQRSYGATLRDFYPNLTAFSSDGEIRGVVGYRSATAAPLFCEHYLDEAVETVAAARLDQAVERRHMVEVGNLALTGMTLGGIYLGGGIPRKILPALGRGGFMRAFTDKGRFAGLLEKVPVRVILSDNATLLGAAAGALQDG